MAASLLPLANPVHEMVMPEVGRTPIKNSPTAQSAYFSAPPEKKSLPVEYASRGMRTKLTACVAS
jgi:hypothetical protein